MVPNVYFNTKLNDVIAANYRPDTRDIMASEGGRLTQVTRDVINEVFILNPNRDWAIHP